MAGLNTNADGSVADPFASIGGLAGLTQLLQSAFGDKTQGASNTNTLTSGTTGKESPLALSFLQQLIPSLQGQVFNQDFSKEAAIRDSAGGVNQILKTLREQALPGVFAAEAASGGYNSTTKQILTNDLSARAAGQAQALVTDTVTKYAGADTARTKSLIDSINSAINAQQNATTQSMSNAATVSDTTDKGLLQNPLALGAAGVMAALSGIQGLSPSIMAALAKAFGFGSASVNADGSINWGDFTGSGDQGGFVGDVTDPTQGFTSPTYPDAGVPSDLLPDPGPIYDPGGEEWFTIG